MKNALLLTILFIGSMVFSQINEFQFEGPKTYPDGKKIAYFHITGVKGNIEAYYIQNNIVDLPEINRFYIYSDDGAGRRCMFEGKSSVDELFIRKSINDLILEFNKQKEDNKDNLLKYYINLLKITDFPEYINTGNEQLDNGNYKGDIESWALLNPNSFKMLEPVLTDIFK